MRPAICKPVAPRIATAMARSHMRMRERSPMFTQSDTAPMVQKWVLLPTAPKMKARAKAPPVTHGTSWAGVASKASVWRLSFRRGEALLGAVGRARLRVLGDQFLERLARRGPIAHRLLRAGDGEHRVRRLLAVGPCGEQLSLRRDGGLVVALPRVRHADPVLGVGRELARGIGGEEALHRRDRERIVAELELV